MADLEMVVGWHVDEFCDSISFFNELIRESGVDLRLNACFDI